MSLIFVEYTLRRRISRWIAAHTHLPKYTISNMIFRLLFKQHCKEMRLLFADVREMQKDYNTLYSILSEAESERSSYKDQVNFARIFLCNRGAHRIPLCEENRLLDKKYVVMCKQAKVKYFVYLTLDEIELIHDVFHRKYLISLHEDFPDRTAVVALYFNFVTIMREKYHEASLPFRAVGNVPFFFFLLQKIFRHR